MISWIINLIKKFISGETDLNNNGVADSKEILKLIQDKMNKKREKENRKKLRKLLR
tara:strand:+ start:2530 stop:2697 length:168 start_codon:yes stop_codon:yes gene_type:complete